MTTRERGQGFGELAEEYDRIRPGYPAELVAAVLRRTVPGVPVIESTFEAWTPYRMLDGELRETVLDGTIGFAVHTYVALARRPA